VETTPQGTITYAPDDADRRTSMLVAGQPDVTYLWDNANRLQTITRQQQPPLVASYEYDAANRRTQLILPNGVAIDYGYDAASRLTSLTYSGLQGGPQTLTYAYDPAGNRVRTGGSWARTLLPAAVSGGTYDAANRQLTLGAKSMTYDLNGNLQTLTESGQTTTYTWDARDRLVALSGPGLTASFAYDAEDRRTQKTITGFSTTFQYDDADVVKEVAAGQTANYLRGLGMDEHLARIEDSGTTCYAGDALGSTVALTDGSAGVSTEYTYEPFGRAFASGAVSGNAFQFTGRENDATGLYYYRARYFAPGASRFVREDPIGQAGGVPNLYDYVSNSPTNFVDPEGLQARPVPRPIPGVRPGAPPIWVPDEIWIPSRDEWRQMGEDIAWAFDPRPLIQTIASGIEACLLFFADQVHGRYWCKVRCNVHPPSGQGYHIEGFGRGSSPEQACKNAQANAKAQLAGRTGHISKHCHTIAQGKR
jgi:RHS repeat-associated protein